jgi:hypothetical protein
MNAQYGTARRVVSASRTRPVWTALAATVLAVAAVPALAQDAGGRGDFLRGPRAQDRGQERGQDRARDRDPDRARRGEARRGRERGGRFGNFGARGAMFQPDFLRRDMRLFVDHLSLDDDQSAIVEALLLDYETAFDAASDNNRAEMRSLFPQREEDAANRERRQVLTAELREIARELRDSRRQDDEVAPGPVDPERLAAMRSRLEAIQAEMRELRPPRPDREQMTRMREEMSRMRRGWQRERMALRAAFLSDLHAVLNERQLELWPAFERTLRREKSIPRGQLSGERIDLFRLLREIGVGADEMRRLESELDDYALMLDDALVPRDRHLETGRDEMFDAMRNDDLAAAIEIAEREAALRIRVRDVNETYAEVLAEQLTGTFDAERGNALRAMFRERAYGRIYRPTVMQRSFSIAAELEGVDAETVEVIRSLESSYLSELALHNDRLHATTRAEEPKRTAERLRQRLEQPRGEDRNRGQGRRRGRWDADDPIRERFDERDELDRRYRPQLEALLTEEQIEELPRLRERRGAGQFRARGDGGAGGDDAARAERRQRMMQLFDKDGDGELNDEEREAVRDYFRTLRRQRGDGEPGNRPGRRRGGGGGGDDR